MAESTDIFEYFVYRDRISITVVILSSAAGRHHLEDWRASKFLGKSKFEFGGDKIAISIRPVRPSHVHVSKEAWIVEKVQVLEYDSKVFRINDHSVDIQLKIEIKDFLTDSIVLIKDLKPFKGSVITARSDSALGALKSESDDTSTSGFDVFGTHRSTYSEDSQHPVKAEPIPEEELRGRDSNRRGAQPIYESFSLRINANGPVEEAIDEPEPNRRNGCESQTAVSLHHHHGPTIVTGNHSNVIIGQEEGNEQAREQDANRAPEDRNNRANANRPERRQRRGSRSAHYYNLRGNRHGANRR
ncbi:uncharacterized protein LOC144431905 [Styela clava]